MHFPKYWALGSSGECGCWEWSDLSLSDAQQKAKRSAERIAALRQGTPADRLNRYHYGQRALREPVIETLGSSADGPQAVVTRNSYGALVLNTARLCFVDVDLTEAAPAPAKRGFFAALFGGAAETPAAPVAADPAVERIERWFSRNPGWAGRLYRTRGGLRLAITSHELTPESSQTEQVFGALGADPLYCRLCKDQRSFRARLTPKPWRCGVDMPPARWPFENAAVEARFARWDEEYKAASRTHAACVLIKELGSGSTRSEFRTLIEHHDRIACGATGAVLA